LEHVKNHESVSETVRISENRNENSKP